MISPPLTSQEAGRRLARALMVGGVVLAAAIVPLLPPIAWKVKATMLAALLLIAAFYLKARTGTLRRSPLDAPALAYLIAAVLATIFSVNPLVSAYPSPLRGEGLLVSAAYIILALAAARLTGGERRTVITAVLVSGTVVAVVAITQYFGVDALARLGFKPALAVKLSGMSFPIWSDVSVWRSYGTLGHPMFLGAFAALLIPVGIMLMLRGGLTPRWAYAAAVLLLCGALVASGTRAAWIASLTATIPFVVLMARPGHTWRPVAVLAAAVVVLTAVMMAARPQAALSARAASTFDTRDGSLRQRLYIWEQTLPLIAQRPVLGWGFSTLLGRFPGLGSPRYREVFGDRAVTLIDNPHNELLNVAFSTGLAGLVAYLWVWAVAVVELLRKVRRRRDPLNIALLASLAAYFIWMQAGWSTIGLAGVFWLFLGLAVAEGAES